MQFRVTVSSPIFASFSSLIFGLVALSIITPKPYNWIILGLIFGCIVFVMVWRMWMTWRYGTFSIQEDSLFFSSHQIEPTDIRHLLLDDKSGTFTLAFTRRRLPFSISCKRKDTDRLLTTLRGWAWRNGVEIKTTSFKPRRRRED